MNVEFLILKMKIMSIYVALGINSKALLGMDLICLAYLKFFFLLRRMTEQHIFRSSYFSAKLSCGYESRILIFQHILGAQDHLINPKIDNDNIIRI